MSLYSCAWILFAFILVSSEVLEMMGAFLVWTVYTWGLLKITEFKGIHLENVLKTRD